MTVFMDQQDSSRQAPKKSAGRKRKTIIAAAVAGAVMVPVGAWAAVNIFGFGQLESAAATTQNLTVNNSTAKLTGKLLPGKTVGAEVEVTNPNDFDVKVTGVIVRKSTLAVTPDSAECNASVKPLGTEGAAAFPQGGGVPGYSHSITAVNIPAGYTVKITVPNVVRQEASATVLCGVKADFAVKAENA